MDYSIIIGITVLFLMIWLNNRQMYNLKEENYKFMKKLKKMQTKSEKSRLAIQKNPINIVKKYIKKEKPESDYIETYRYVRINSADRDIERFPNAADFEHVFGETIKNIKSVELQKFSMPKSMYTIDDHNYKMVIRDLTQDVKFTLAVPYGFYSIGAYKIELNKQFGELNMDLRVEFDKTSHVITLLNMGVDTVYQILYSTEEFEETNFNVIGFKPLDFILQPGENKTGERRVDLFGATNLGLQLKNVSFGYGDDILANILVKENTITSYENDNTRPRRIISPLLSLNKVTFVSTFKPHFKERRLYEFNGMNFVAVLEIVSLERRMPFEQIIPSKYG
jgi:hypothetical protein